MLPSTVGGRSPILSCEPGQPIVLYSPEHQLIYTTDGLTSPILLLGRAITLALARCYLPIKRWTDWPDVREAMLTIERDLCSKYRAFSYLVGVIDSNRFSDVSIHLRTETVSLVPWVVAPKIVAEIVWSAKWMSESLKENVLALLINSRWLTTITEHLSQTVVAVRLHQHKTLQTHSEPPAEFSLSDISATFSYEEISTKEKENNPTEQSDHLYDEIENMYY